MIRNRPMQYTVYTYTVGRQPRSNQCKDYRRNLLEFLERLEELFNRNRETRWHMVKSILDGGFKNVADNWWTAICNEVNSYEQFKQLFKLVGVHPEHCQRQSL